MGKAAIENMVKNRKEIIVFNDVNPVALLESGDIDSFLESVSKEV